jgi:hypothetical protein
MLESLKRRITATRKPLPARAAGSCRRLIPSNQLRRAPGFDPVSMRLKKQRRADILLFSYAIYDGIRRIQLGETMICRRSMPLIFVMGCLGAGVAAAAPPQLFHKTIVVSWSREVIEQGTDGSIRNISRNDTRQFYVSTAGRVFMRFSAQTSRRSSTHDYAPGDDTTLQGRQESHFEGNRLIFIATHISGAHRITINFDPGFTGCAATFMYGKERGAPIVWRGINGETYKVISNTVTSSSCEIKAGNLFEGQ